MLVVLMLGMPLFAENSTESILSQRASLTLANIRNIIQTYNGTLSKKQISKLSKMIYFLSKSHRLDPLLVLAVIQEESSFSVDAVSPKGALGLMQIMPETGSILARRLGIKTFEPEQLLNPYLNVRMGIYYLDYLRKRFRFKTLHYLSAYNMGPFRFSELLNEGYAFQYDYARKVLETHRGFQYHLVAISTDTW